MKRLIITVTAIGFIIVAAGYGIIFTKDTRDTLSATISQAVTSCKNGNQQAAEEYSKQLKEEFDERSGVLSLYVRHDELERIEELLVDLRSNIDSGELIGAWKSLYSIEYLLEHIYHHELPNLDNIF